MTSSMRKYTGTQCPTHSFTLTLPSLEAAAVIARRAVQPLPSFSRHSSSGYVEAGIKTFRPLSRPSTNGAGTAAGGGTVVDPSSSEELHSSGCRRFGSGSSSSEDEYTILLLFAVEALGEGVKAEAVTEVEAKEAAKPVGWEAHEAGAVAAVVVVAAVAVEAGSDGT